MADSLPPRDTSGKFVSPSALPLNPETAPASTAAPAGAPAAAQTPPKAPAKEGREEKLKNLNRLTANFLGIKPKEDATPPAQPDKGKSKDKEEPTPPAAAITPPKSDEPKPATPKKPKAPPAQPALTAEQIAAAAAEGATRALKSTAGKPAEPAKPAAPELPEADSRRARIYDHIEQMDGLRERYPGIGKKFRDWIAATSAYADRWEAEHPGQAFDPTSEEHNGFYEQHPEPEVEDEDYTEAIADMRAEEKIKKRLEPINERIDKDERARKFQEAQPAVAQHAVAAARSYWKALGDQFADIIGENGEVNHAKLQELAKQDPVSTGIRVNAARALSMEVPEFYRIMNGLGEIDQKNPVHAAVNDFGYMMEQRILKSPREDQLDGEGRQFRPLGEYWQLPEKDRERFWTFSADDMIAMRAKFLSDQAQKSVQQEEEKFVAMARARGIEVPPRNGATPPASANGEDNSPVSTDGKPHSPQSASPPKMATSRTATPAGPVSPVNAWVGKFLGRT